MADAARSAPRIGAFVKVVTPPASDLGVGKLVRIVGKEGVVAYFDVPGASDGHEVVVPRRSIVAVDLPIQTRVFRYKNTARRWQVGRVQDGSGPDLLVQFPNADVVNVSEEDLQVRWDRPISDPMAFLVREVTETPQFAAARTDFLKGVVAQRSACLGIGAVLSSAIQLESYQFNVVRRVLEDPIQRYLLADEVGLGKTVEAGVLIRQYLLDEGQTASVLIIVPATLASQWTSELVERFALEEWLNDFVRVVASDDLAAISRHISSAGMLVVDEAHHLARGDAGQDGALYRLLREHSPRLRRLLLLSATPVLSDTAGFLRVLHLLDPVVFPLDDLTGFERRVQSRQVVAEALSGLVPENLLVLESDLDRLESTFGDDEILVELVAHLRPIVQALPDEEDERFLEALGALRAHLSETYKLHRRMLRNRRKSCPWATPGRKGLTLEMYRCSASADRYLTLEELRLHMVNADSVTAADSDLWAAAIQPTTIAPLTEQLRQRGIEDMQTLELARRVDRFSSQSRSSGARLEATLRVVRSLLVDDAMQVVIFCDRKEDADAVYEQLMGAALPCKIHRHASERQVEEVGYEPWREFLTQPRTSRLLVCDASAEEGLNLHGGRKAAVHFDLPASPNRIEQRLGRLDRFGSGDAVRSIAIACEQELDEVAWVHCLRDGFRVFDASIATLQYLIGEVMRPVPGQWCLQGVTALRELAVALGGDKGWIARERRRIDQQDAIDALGETSSDTFDELEAVDGQWTDWRAAVDSFAVEVLQFGKRQEQWKSPLPAREQVFRLSFSTSAGRNTLIPVRSFISDFLGAVDFDAPGGSSRNPMTHAYSFRRPTALSKEGREMGVRPLRYGDPLVSALQKFCARDDRGRVFAMWRHRRNYQASDASGTDLFFRFDYLVQPDFASTQAGETPSSDDAFRALRRRGDGIFPPKFITVWVSADAAPIERMPAELAEMYSRDDVNDDAGRDYNLNADRWHLLQSQSDVPWTREWPQLCQRIRVRADDLIAAEASVQAAIHQARVSLRQQHATRAAQISTRIARLNGLAREAELSQRDDEEKLYQWLLAAVSSPSCKLDSVGAVFLSARALFRQ
jgi:ATP-dependent helicase HepA